MPRYREFRISDFLVVLVLVPLVSLALFRRWQKNRAAKRAEIRKLLLLAAEEAARAEEEAAQVYTSTFVTRYQCALCFSPSTTRCSRCKAVRYCSGKCQIAHWRQGHKYECQPPDIDDSNASLPRVSAEGREINLNSISEPQNVESNNANVQGLNTSAEASDQSKESISELSPSKRSEDSASKIDPVIANEKPDVNYAIPKVLDFSVKSSINSATHTASLRDALVPNDPMHENYVPDVPVNNTEYLLGTTRSDKPSTEGFITDVPTQKPSVSSISSSTSANNVLSSMVSASDFPVSKNERNELPGSGTSSFEHNIHNSTSCTQNLCVSMDEPDLPVARNNPPISEESVHDNFTLKTAKHSSSASAHVVNPSRSFNSGTSINGHMVESSRSHNQSPSTSKTVTDDLTGKYSMKNITNLGNLVTSSSGQKDSTSVNSKSFFNSMSRTDVHMGDASSSCNHSSSTSKKVVDSQTRKSPINNTLNSGESVTSFSGQKNPVPLAPSSKISQKTSDDSSSSTSSVSLDSTSMVMNTKIAASKVENQRASELSGTSRRSVRSAFQNSSPLKERAPVCSVSRQKNGSHDIISSNTFHTVVSSLPTGNALKASVKKVAQQLKSSKALKQSSTKMINDSSGKSNQTLFPYESFVKLFNWDKLELPPCGLINCGNSCYANVVLQCLIFTRPVSAYLLQGSHSKN